MYYLLEKKCLARVRPLSVDLIIWAPKGCLTDESLV